MRNSSNDSIIKNKVDRVKDLSQKENLNTISIQNKEQSQAIISLQNQVSAQTSVVRHDEKEPPASISAEQALLAALLYNNSTLEKVNEFLHPLHFSYKLYGDIYGAIASMVDTGNLASPITIAQYFGSNEEISNFGGSEKFFADLVANNSSIINVYDYGRIIYDMYVRRCLINIGENIVNRANDIAIDNEPMTQLETAEKEIYDLAESRLKGKQDNVSFSEILTQVNKYAVMAKNSDCNVVGLTSGMPSLDNALGGLHNSDLIILAARPSMGKTSLAMRIAFNCAKTHLKREQNNTGGPVAIFSLEMSAEQLVARLLGQEAKVAPDCIRNGKLTNDDLSRFAEINTQLSGLPLFIDDSPALTISALRSRARRLKRRFNIRMIIVDYLQLLHGDNIRNAMESRVNEISYITRSLKALAKELDLPIIALSQLSRAVEQREDKRPQLSDLRESGSIEQDADVVMFIYRASYYMARSEPKENTPEHQKWLEDMESNRNIAEILIAKQRHGPIGKVKLGYHSKYTIFTSLHEGNDTTNMLVE